MAKRTDTVVLKNTAFDELPDGKIILRGVLVQDTCANLRIDDYQREASPASSLESILDALSKGNALPDIELGMRGQRFREQEDGSIVLYDPVFIIDGQQRRNGVLHHLETGNGAQVHLGAVVHFDTDHKWERDRFRVLNLNRLKVSPNVLLRNLREDSKALLMLYGLTTREKEFALFERVAWGQRMARGELITALTFAKVSGVLHSHKVAGNKSQRIDELVPALDKVVEVVGLQQMRANVRTFFGLIDECWGIRRIHYKDGAAYMRGQFLDVLARVLSDHYEFWQDDEEKKLVVEATLRRKIAKFSVDCRHVQNLAGAGGKSREILYALLRDHINSGKRSGRLVSRHGDMVSFSEESENEATAAE